MLQDFTDLIGPKNGASKGFFLDGRARPRTAGMALARTVVYRLDVGLARKDLLRAEHQHLVGSRRAERAAIIRDRDISVQWW